MGAICKELFNRGVFAFQVNAMFNQIGYPSFIKNETALEEYFEGVSRTHD